MSSLRLDWCSHEAAKHACKRWHYSGDAPNQKLLKIGVWESGEFVGAILFGSSANNNLGKPYGLTGTEACELVRVALKAHETPVSRMGAIALRMLKKSNPGIRLVVSYADPEHDHVGGIYQAMNWVYAGMTTPADEYIVNGVRMHGRALRSTRSTHKRKNVPAQNIMEWAAAVLDPNVRRVAGSSKHRYLYPLDDDMRERINPLAKPYPKRASEAGHSPSPG